jgi:hypothetical protein
MASVSPSIAVRNVALEKGSFGKSTDNNAIDGKHGQLDFTSPKSQRKEENEWTSNTQLDLQYEMKAQKSAERQSMKKSKLGRSIIMVKDAIKLAKPHAAKSIEPVGKDDTVL